MSAQASVIRQVRSIGVSNAGAKQVTSTSNIVVTGVFLSGSTIFTQVANAGTVVGAISVTTSPPSSYGGQVSLGGPDAGLFSLTNSGFLPSNLVVGGANIGPGAYNITLTAN